MAVVLAAAEPKYPLQLGREGPQRTALGADLPAGFIQVDHGGVSDQAAQQVEFPVPVLGQLPQQRIGLRPGERQLTEEGQHLASLAQRDADDVHQVGRRPSGIRIGTRRLVAYLGLVLRQPFREASDFRFQALVVGTQALVIGLDFRQAPFQFRPAVFRLRNPSIVQASVHAISIAQADAVSCASLHFFCSPA